MVVEITLGYGSLLLSLFSAAYTKTIVVSSEATFNSFYLDSFNLLSINSPLNKNVIIQKRLLESSNSPFCLCAQHGRNLIASLLLNLINGHKCFDHNDLKYYLLYFFFFFVLISKKGIYTFMFLNTFFYYLIVHE